MDDHPSVWAYALFAILALIIFILILRDLPGGKERLSAIAAKGRSVSAIAIATALLVGPIYIVWHFIVKYW